MKKLFIRLAILGLVVFFIQYKFYENFTFNYPVLQRLLKINIEGKLIFFEASVDNYSAPEDIDKRSISTRLDSLLKDREVIAVTHGAYEMNMFEQLVRFLIRNHPDEKPYAFVIPVNLRSFSPVWDLRPDWQFRMEKALLKQDVEGAFYMSLSIFKWNKNSVDYEVTRVAI